MFRVASEKYRHIDLVAPAPLTNATARTLTTSASPHVLALPFPPCLEALPTRQLGWLVARVRGERVGDVL